MSTEKKIEKDEFKEKEINDEVMDETEKELDL